MGREPFHRKRAAACLGGLPLAFWLCLAMLGSAKAALAAAPAPVETRVEASLLTPVSTYSSKKGARVEALIRTPLCLGDVSLPAGSTVEGAVGRVRRVGFGLVHETALLELNFEALHLPDGTDYPVPVRVLRVDNARERVGKRGDIHGMRATASFSNRFGERLAFLAFSHPLLVSPLFAAENALLRFPDPEIEYGRGTELDLTIQFPDSLRGLSACALPEAGGPEEDLEELQRIVDNLPYWSYSKRHSQPMDLVNLVFVGPEESVDAAFQAAGWRGSEPNSMRAGFGAIRAILEDRSDDDAPMRTLLLDGAEPAKRLQKSLNTFEKRHHLRVWKRSDQWQGQSVWASAATEDIHATFSLNPFGFTHAIADDVDRERDKVVRDLAYTGCADSVTYLRRTSPVRGPGRDYRKGIYTDSRVAVVALNSCRQPKLDVDPVSFEARPSLFVRCSRRITLTARNHWLRDNMVWRSADALIWSVRVLHRWCAQRKDERTAKGIDMAPAPGPPGPGDVQMAEASKGK